MLAVTIPIEKNLGDFFAFGTQENSLGILITRAIDVIIIFAILLSLLFIIIGGISWITAGSSKDQLETARGRVIHALIGLIITIAAYTIWVLIVKQMLGIDIEGGVELKVINPPN